VQSVRGGAGAPDMQRLFGRRASQGIFPSLSRVPGGGYSGAGPQRFVWPHHAANTERQPLFSPPRR
jgi:hypothetical protein